MLRTSSSVAVGPARICAGSPGIKSTKKKTSSETANSVGRAWARRLRTNMRAHPPQRRSFHRNLVERQRFVGLHLQALNPVRNAERLGLVPKEDEGRLVPDDLLNLAVDLLLLGGIGGTPPFGEQLVDAGIAVASPVRADAGAEQAVERVVHAGGGAAHHPHVVGAACRIHADDLAPSAAVDDVRRRLDPDVLERAGNGLADLRVLDVTPVRASQRQGQAPGLVAGLGQELLRPFRVE